MEIISQITEAAHTIPVWLFWASLAAVCLGIMVAADGNKTCDDGEFFIGAIVAGLGTILCVLFLIVNADDKVPEYRYRIRIDDETTVSQLLEKYDVIEYDKEYDVWIVDLKKNTAE